jgi:hypothetical protein
MSILHGKVIGERGWTRKKKDITAQEPEDMVLKKNHRAF